MKQRRGRAPAALSFGVAVMCWLGLAAIPIAGAPRPPSSHAGLTQLFNGKDLTGWASAPPPTVENRSGTPQAAPQADLARQLLDASKPNAEREKILAGASYDAGTLITEMVSGMQPGTPEEYVRIPWIWRAAVAAGKRNQTAELKSVLSASLPKPVEPLREWQAVVIGGGVVNGISLTGAWPGVRVQELLRGDQDLRARWKRVPDLAAAMADDEKVKTGTRYDALRILGVESWKRRGAHLTKYLASGTPNEVQQGAIGALNDVDAKEVAPALLAALPNFSDRNRNAALNALLRDRVRMAALLEAVAAGHINRSDLGDARTQKLTSATDKKVRQRAERLLR